jgi:hypothetical protein
MAKDCEKVWEQAAESPALEYRNEVLSEIRDEFERMRERGNCTPGDFAALLNEVEVEIDDTCAEMLALFWACGFDGYSGSDMLPLVERHTELRQEIEEAMHDAV